MKQKSTGGTTGLSESVQQAAANQVSQSKNKNSSIVSNNDKNITNKVQQAMQLELMSKDGDTKREYKLKVQLKFEHFLEFFKSELITRDLLYVIDKSAKAPAGLNDEIKERHVYKVRDILINRVDEEYHSKLLKLQDPVVMLEVLKDFKPGELNITSARVRQQLHSIKYQIQQETALEF